ncbi:hypothetical protein Tco_0999520 [Tanacetum coccineum]
MPILTTTRAVIDVHEGESGLRVGNLSLQTLGKSYEPNTPETIIFIAWITPLSCSKSIVLNSPVEPLEWKASENRLKPSSIKPSKLELNELPEHLEYAFLQENNQLPIVISSALSTVEKAKLLEVLKNHKGAIA